MTKCSPPGRTELQSSTASGWVSTGRPPRAVERQTFTTANRRPATIRSASAGVSGGASAKEPLALGALKGPTLAAVDARISQVIGYPPEYFADIEVHRVEPGGKSDMHYDWEPSLYQEQIITLLLCLGHVNEGDGGETLFPYANPPVKVRPVKGLAIVYHNIGEDGYPDRFAFRGDAELQNGTKW